MTDCDALILVGLLVSFVATVLLLVPKDED